MSSQIWPQPRVNYLNIASNKILESRNQYRPCHIRVPDMEDRLPAIWVEGSYYSFLKVVADRQRAIELTGKLSAKGDRTVITPTSKGYVIWVLEPEAYI